MRRATCCCRRSFMTAQVGAHTHTFFGDGHCRAHRICGANQYESAKSSADSARSLGVTVHNGGTYVNMDGPAFSTRAESEFNHRNGFDVIAMTNLPEAKLAREAEIAFATMAMITDYDCWKVEEEPVSAEIGTQPFNGECRNGEENDCGCNSTNPNRTELAGTFRLGYRADHRP